MPSEVRLIACYNKRKVKRYRGKVLDWDSKINFVKFRIQVLYMKDGCRW